MGGVRLLEGGLVRGDLGLGRGCWVGGWGLGGWVVKVCIWLMAYDLCLFWWFILTSGFYSVDHGVYIPLCLYVMESHREVCTEYVLPIWLISANITIDICTRSTEIEQKYVLRLGISIQLPMSEDYS